VSRILFVTATRIGDAVLSTGLLSYILERHPASRITIAAGPDAAPLFASVPRLERVVVMRKQRHALHWLTLWAEVAAQRWDLVVDLRGSGLSYCLWARERRIAAKGDFARHRVEHLATLFGLDPPPSPRLWLTDEDMTRAAALVPTGGPVLGVGPAANWRGKEWPAERFAELTRRLTSRDGPLPNARVAIFAAAHERAQTVPVLEAIPPHRRLDVVGVDLRTAAAALGRCALFIGNDSGIMHVAAAARIPTLGLFGPSLASHYAPWGDRAAVVSTSIPAEEIFRRGFDYRTTGTLMESLSVEAAEDAARRLMERVAGAAA
jgi:heptosyltransferase III